MPSSESARPAADALRGQLDRIFSFDVSSGRSYEELIEALATLGVEAKGDDEQAPVTEAPGAEGPKAE